MALVSFVNLSLPGILITVLLMVEIGRRAGLWHRRRVGDLPAGTGAIEGACSGCSA